MILITGGTGLVGAHLLYQLTQKHERLRATRRPKSDLENVKKVFAYYTSRQEAEELFSRIEWVNASINDIPALEEAFRNIDLVYHCAALISFDPADEKRLRKINIEGTANVVNLCIANSIKKLCYVSSVAALGQATNGKPIDEMSKWNPELNHSDYAISKYGAEIEVWRGSQEGVDTVIINPGIIIGPGFWDAGSGRIFKRIDNGLNYHFPKVSGFVGVEDTVRAMIELMESNLINEKFVLVAENLSFRNVLADTATAMGKPKPKRQLKTWMVFLGWIFQKIGSWFGMKRELSHDSIKNLFSETRYSSEKIKETLGFEFTPVRVDIENTAQLYLKDKGST